ncbi:MULTISPECIES: hypothetical protein [unclassified Microbacterium]|uniref:hypothetical protein n=1 Tax=unclassified Microbacterium TaxID=2609290 RepID=UPI000CFDCD9B|nr:MULTISPECIES: hypothetical protein [unclassified Microbacterium]PQZ60684.1 hypothetical protein CQ032_04050 [Microbacterium sp. MYb43]PQZ82110.1 hypothetical protein CQ031_01450 [Microbacterium sp. MYb40]PRB22960.1 hypothetical protein CQ037_18155 [Microbacterium sp. MYb50]PRB24190.1 hypothetical protein CQ040_02780 [Microbacterium sp. MYb54]PRB69674.1 hypothetical protein CQ021_02785 [Microbacterium sp. MYb24]
MRLDVRRSPALTALIQVLATIPNEVAKENRKRTKAVVVPEWKKGLAERAPGERIFHERLVSPSTAYVSDRNVKLIGGANGKFPRETEFGAYREEVAEYTGRRNGTSFPVKRRAQRQFWHFQKSGRVVWPTASDLIPRIASLWIQTTIRTVHESIEKGTR